MVRILFVCAGLLFMMGGRNADAFLIVRGGLGVSVVSPGASNCTEPSLSEAAHMRRGYPPHALQRCSGVLDGIVALASIDALMPDHIVHVLTDPHAWNDPIQLRTACIVVRGSAERCRSVQDRVAIWCEFNAYVSRVGRRGRHVMGKTQHLYTYETQRVGQWKDPC